MVYHGHGGHLIPIILQSNHRRDALSVETCPFCGRTEDVNDPKAWRKSLNHIANEHLKPLALLSLPWHVGPTDCASASPDAAGSRSDGSRQ
jgi:hypothetical protein